LVLTVFGMVLTTSVHAQPFGLPGPRVANTSLLIDELPGDTPDTMQLVRMFPRVGFAEAVHVAEAPGQPGHLYVVEKAGRIHRFPKTADPAPGEVQLFLNISTSVATASEQGLLSMAFDPDYATNGRFYVYYSWNGGSPSISRIARFTNNNPAGMPTAAMVQQPLLEFAQPFSNHNGGWVGFGLDGMLYISSGDGGSANDPQNNGQNLNTLLGKILRIDVRGTPDPGLAYRIPPANPFLGVPNTRAEIWAYGLRNPWRMGFDMIEGHLFAGDVGQNTLEEIDVIERGRNYGWRRMEGTLCFNPSTNCNPGNLTLPIAEYGRTVGQSITGGSVYYGGAVPDLYGMYIYADFITKRVFGLRYKPGTANPVEGPFALVASSPGVANISSISSDSTGELYFTDYRTSGGGLWVLRPAQPSGGGSFPTRLSTIPALLSAGRGQDQVAQGIYPYRPSAQLWSDGAEKERYMALPGLAQVTYTAADAWGFPNKSVLIKNFLLPLDLRDPLGSLKRIETRLMYKLNDVWYGFSYEWEEDGNDARLLTTSRSRSFTVIGEDGEPFGYNWYYPSRTDCGVCHTAAAGDVLGITTAQLNGDFGYPSSGVTDNQLRSLANIALFTSPLPGAPSTLPKMPNPHDTTQPLNSRARAYLAANCSMCHRPAGGTTASLDLRWERPNGAMIAFGVAPVGGSFGLDDPLLLAAGEAGRSLIPHRMSLRSPQAGQMPPLGTSRADTSAVRLMNHWLETLQATEASSSLLHVR